MPPWIEAITVGQIVTWVIGIGVVIGGVRRARMGADLVTAAHIPSGPRQRRIWDMKVPV